MTQEEKKRVAEVRKLMEEHVEQCEDSSHEFCIRKKERRFWERNRTLWKIHRFFCWIFNK